MELIDFTLLADNCSVLLTALPHYGHVIWHSNLWLGRQDYEIRRVFRPPGHQQKTLMFKIAPGNFVEPVTARFLPSYFFSPTTIM